MDFDIPAAYLAAASGLSLTAITGALVNFGEYREFKKNTAAKIDSNFKTLKEEIDAHEERDNERHKEVIERISDAEKNILEVFKRG